MKELKGFTLVELMIVVAIIAILAAAIAGNFYRHSEWGVICKAGYKFSTDANGYQQQIIDDTGHAIPCQ